MKKVYILTPFVFLQMVLFSYQTPLCSEPAAPMVVHPEHHDTSSPLSEVAESAYRVKPRASEVPNFPLIQKEDLYPIQNRSRSGGKDPLVQDRHSPLSMPEPEVSFEGISNVNGAYPPDPQGDVSPDHYVQVVNRSFAVWDKEGTLLHGPADLKSLWEGFGGPCEYLNHGDPIVLYDHLADRWLLSRFALPNGKFDGPYYQCIAVSKTPDPTDQWHRYAYRTSPAKFNDYPKFGIWPDGYYMSVNQFESGHFAGPGTAAFEREKMLQGLDARMIYFDLEDLRPGYGGMLPSDLDGPPPPAGMPNYFVQFQDDAWDFPEDQLEIWTFRTDWSAPENARFERIARIPAAPFDADLCRFRRDCIPQPDTEAGLDAISDRLMFRLQYRNFGTHQSMVANHSVDADGADHAGIRWYELRDEGAGWAIRQQGTFAPDPHHRWMGSLAMDRHGNIALGYSLSGRTTYPSLAYTGRLAADPLDRMTQGETVLAVGEGSQTGSHHRWGDYSMMSVDPADGCTFWYTGEYYTRTKPSQWQTRIGAFRFPSCTDGPGGELTGRVTDAAGMPLEGARVMADPAATLTDPAGQFRFAHLAMSERSVTAAAYGYVSRTNSVAIEAGKAAQQNFRLGPLPSRMVEGRITDDLTGWPLYTALTFSAPGFTRTLFTDPLSGRYRIELFAGIAYDLEIRSLLPGYRPVARSFSPGEPADFRLTADEGCAAPGYGLFEEGFDICGPTSQWRRTDLTGNGFRWQITAGGETGNRTGGAGCFAVSSPGASAAAEIDTALVSPGIDCSDLRQVILSFRYDYRTRTGEDGADVEVSPDGGATWLTVWQSPDTADEGPNQAVVDISEQAAGQDRIRVRFRHHHAFRQGTWQIDDVAISGGSGPCIPPPPGGLVVGNVYDRVTGTPVNDVIVASDGGASTMTLATPDDPDLEDGFYALYVPTGTHRLRAGKSGFYPDTRTLSVTDGGAVSFDFHLSGAHLTAEPAALEVEVPPGGSAVAIFTLTNAGGLYAAFTATAASPAGAETPWITLSPEEGLVPAKNSVEIRASLEAPEREPGDRLEAVIEISGSDPSPPLQVPVTLVVTDRSLPEEDAVVTRRDQNVVIDILANDYLAGPEAPAIELTALPIHGTAEITGDGIRYTPDEGYTGRDRLAYALEGTPADVTIEVWDLLVERRSSVEKAIPDGAYPGAASSVRIEETDGAVVERVRATLTLHHPYLSDLSGWLVSPDGVRVLLFEDLTGEDLIRTTWSDLSFRSAPDSGPPHNGSFRPMDPLATFTGHPASGEWTLEIVDHAQLDAGRLVEWELEIFHSRQTVITVDDVTDAISEDGRCTLREAVMAANTDSPAGGCPPGGERDVIRLPAGRFALTLAGTDENQNRTGDLDIRAPGSVAIMGASGGGTIIETRLSDRLIHVHSGSDVALAHLTLQGGFIDPEAILLLGGGAILNQNSRLRIDNCTVSANEAGLGGGIHSDRGDMTIRSSTIVGNTGQNGGGLLDTFGRTEIIDTTFRGNHAGLEGGGIDSLGGDITLTRTTLHDNSAAQGGGAIHNQFGDLRLNASTLSDNRALNGGGLLNNSGTARFSFVSVIDNTAVAKGGGLCHLKGDLELENSLVARNRVEVQSATADISGRVTSRGGNLIGRSSGGSGYRYGDDLLDVAALALPLADNGGATLTPALRINSPAVDAVACTRFEPDQRGVHRPVNGRCDIGAFEHDRRPYPPAAGDDRGVSRGDPVLVDVLANDGDANGDPLTISVRRPPENGTVQLNGTSLRYTPDPGFLGEDTFRYAISDGTHEDTATVTMTVEANTPPSLRDDEAEGVQDGWITIDVLENDSDRDGHPLALFSVSTAGHGTTLMADNRIYYLPDQGFLGRDSFTYEAGDGIDADRASVTVTVWESDGVIRVDTLADEVIPDGRCSLREAISAAETREPVDTCAAGGFQSIVYLPPGLFRIAEPPPEEETASPEADPLSGALDLVAGRGRRRGDPAGGTILEGVGGHRVLHIHEGAEAEIRDLTLRGGEPIAPDDTEADLNGGLLNQGFLRVVAATLTRNHGEVGGAIRNHGDLILQNATVSGNIALKGGGLFNQGYAALSFTTLAANHAVYDGGGIHTVSGRTELNHVLAAGNTAGRHGPDRYGPVESRGGNLFGDIGEDPTEPFTGTDILNVDPLLVPLADNGGASPTHALRIDSPAVDAVACLGIDGGRVHTDQRGVDRPREAACDIGAFEHDHRYYPPAAEDDRAAVQNDRGVIIPVLSNDGSAGALPLFVARISPPEHGSATDNLDGTLLYTPDPGFVGVDRFEYTVSDKRAVDTATVTVSVGLNQPPVAGDDAAETFQRNPVAVPVLENDRDPDGYVLFVSAVGMPANGTAVSDGAVITYTPDPDFSGVDAFAYHVSDGALTDKGRVSVTVTGITLADALAALKVLSGIDLSGHPLDQLAGPGGKIDLATVIRILRSLAR